MDELKDKLARASAEAQPPSAPQPIAVGPEAIRQKAIAAIQEVYDPEIPVNIWELGLIYEVEVTEQRDVTVQMTLTSPACPAAQDLPIRVRAAISRIPEVADVDVQIVWDPPWTPDRMSEIAKLELGMF
jgi:FeS assembly SUF system protein